MASSITAVFPLPVGADRRMFMSFPKAASNVSDWTGLKYLPVAASATKSQRVNESTHQ